MTEPEAKKGLIAYEYGAMSSKYRLFAANKLTAYVAMICHFESSNHLIVVYSPEECNKDSWASFDGKVAARLDEIFGGENAFDKYLAENTEEIKQCLNTIERIV